MTQQDTLLELWKTTAQLNRLEDACPHFVRSAQKWGDVDRLLIVRWESELGFLEPLVDYSPDNADAILRKQKCEPSLITELKRLFGGRPVLKIDDRSQMPTKFLEMFSISAAADKSLWLGLLKPDNNLEAVALLELRPQASAGNALGNELAGSFPAFFFEGISALAAVLERESLVRRLGQMREAAEAEKNAILAKLGRQDLNAETIVGADRGLKRVFERLEMIASAGTPVLLIGETGSGKALVARSIHNRSGRASQPFLRFNCGAVTSELLETQLFGGREAGAFERVSGGTIFLDDIHLLTASAQSRLITLLDRGIIESPKTRKSKMIDVRVVVATDRDLSGEIAGSQFSEELWYKLALFPIRLPSLRERLDDLPELALHFAKRTASRFGLPFVAPTERDLEFLKGYSWPGNVRELGTVIDRAALLGNGKSLDVMTALGVPDGAILAPDWNAKSAARQSGKTRRQAIGTIDSLDEVVRQYLEYVLDATGGRIEGPNGAAALLDVNPNTLRSKLKKLGLNSRDFKNRNG